MKKGTVLIVDDEDKLRNLFGRIISTEGYEVIEAMDCKTALKKIANNNIDVVLCDVKLPDGNGLELIAKLKTLDAFVEIILLTAYGNIADGVQAIKLGACDYIVKGDDNEKILPLISRAAERSQLQKRIKQLEQKVQDKFSFSSIIGKSKNILDAIALAKKVAPNDTIVLLTGETGTGKEVFAHAIHHASTRAEKAFVALNCSTFSKEIIESELFGHKQGAFTGALKDKKGLLEEADNGTLFLDEIGELPLELQAKLLRVIESNEFIKLGDTKTTRVNFRLITATNRDLKRESEQNSFRIDLYYRINVFQIQLPALKERVKDIHALTAFFVHEFSAKTNKKTLQISSNFMQALEKYKWPGNIRELKNIVERSVILEETNTLQANVLPFEIQNPPLNIALTSSHFALNAVEKHHIQSVLTHTKGNKAEAARLLEIGIATLYRKLEEYKIS